jgi:ABC-type nitrate/sulfonate/bicarbonate transport system permease component
VLIAAWEGWVRWRGTKSYLLPAPSRIAAALWDTRSLLAAHTRTTLTETVIGIVLGALLGVVLAVAVSSSGLVRRVLEPLLVASQTIPLIVLAPLLVYWFGFGMTPKVVVVILIVFFPVAVSTTSGLSNADREQLDLVRSFGASRVQVLRLVLVPAALPSFFSGLRISAAYSVAGATFGELIGGRSGLGIYIARSQRAFRYDQILAGVVVVAALSAVLFGLIYALARLATPWQYVAASPTRAQPGDRASGTEPASGAASETAESTTRGTTDGTTRETTRETTSETSKRSPRR